jgi:predicted extracellular nuclease
VTATTPANNATEVALGANVTVTFSEPVTVTGSWFTISCTTSGQHTAAVSGGPTTFTLDPDSDFAEGEACAVCIASAQVADIDTDDLPDQMAADFAFSFTTPVEIHDIQGGSHTSLLVGRLVSGVRGVVTARLGNGFYLQDPTPDADEATSEAVFVFTSSAPTVAVGDALLVAGRVAEFRPGGATSTNLTTTEITSPAISVVSSGGSLPAPTVLGAGGRTPPNLVIEDDASGSVETSGIFDPAEDGIDFYESVEAIRVQVNDALVVGPRSQFGEVPVVGDAGADAGVDTVRGGVVIRPNDFNPERIILDDTIIATPAVDVADRFTTPAVGFMDYSFANFKLKVTAQLTPVDGGLEREVTRRPRDQEIVVGTYNVENLDSSDGDAFARHADPIVNHLRSPDLIAIEEIQDDDGAVDSAVTDASVTWNMLIAAIETAGGPTYFFRQIDPVDDEDGGEPGGNIRVGFLFRTDRGLSFITRPGGSSTAQRLRVLRDGRHPRGRRAHDAHEHAAEARAVLLRLRGKLAGARPDPRLGQPARPLSHRLRPRARELRVRRPGLRPRPAGSEAGPARAGIGRPPARVTWRTRRRGSRG